METNLHHQPFEGLNSGNRKAVKGKTCFLAVIALFQTLYLTFTEVEKESRENEEQAEEFDPALSFFLERGQDYFCCNVNYGLFTQL